MLKSKQEKGRKGENKPHSLSPFLLSIFWHEPSVTVAVVDGARTADHSSGLKSNTTPLMQ
jgi:hypothetical protein